MTSPGGMLSSLVAGAREIVAELTEPPSARWVVRVLCASVRQERKALLAALCAALVGALLISLGTPAWWLGGALECVAAVVLAQALREPGVALGHWLDVRRRVLGVVVHPRAALLDVFYVAVLVCVASVMMSEILGGERPVSHDHTVHYFKAWQMHEYFLSQGRLQGWSHRWFAGDPVNYLYPIGADLWVNLVYALSFGLMTFSQAYARAFWLFHVFTGYAGYRFGRVVGGPHVGLVTGLLMLTDLSEFRLGGWAYTINYGVWPQALALDFALLALCSVPAIVQGRRLGPIGAFGFFMGLAILSHPIVLLFLPAVLALVVLATCFADDARGAAGVFRLLAGYVLAVVVSAVWLVPFWSVRGESSVMGIWWDSAYEMGKGLLDLDAFPGTLGWVLACGVLALAVVLRTRRFVLLFTAFGALGVPVVFGSTFVDELHLASLSTAITKVQFIRMATMVKPFWFALAAFLLVAVFARARVLLDEHTPSSPGAGSRTIGRAGLALVVAWMALPILVPAGQAFWTRHVAKALVTESDRPLAQDRRAMVAWVKQHLPRQGFYRLGIMTGHFHDLFDLGAEINQPLFKRGFTPATNFVYRMRDEHRAIFEAVNLRYALSKRWLPREDWSLLQRFNGYGVYEFKHWNPQPFRVLEGAGDVKVERFRDEEIVLRAAPGAHGVLRLNVSYFSRWQATRDGQPVPIGVSYLPESPDDTGFMTVPLTPGRYRFAFERTAGDRAALPITLVGLLVSAGLALADRRRRGLAWLAWPLEEATRILEALSGEAWRRRRMLALGATLAAVAGVFLALAQWRPAIALQEVPHTAVARVRYDFLENLSRARGAIDYRESPQRCKRQGDRLVCRDPEGNLDNERYIGSSPATITEYTMVRCIRARPEEGALLGVTYRGVPVGDAIVGYYGIERAGRLLRRKRPVNFSVRVNGTQLYDEPTQSDNKMHWFQIPLNQVQTPTVDVSFTVSADNVSKRYFCFNAQMVDLK